MWSLLCRPPLDVARALTNAVWYCVVCRVVAHIMYNWGVASIADVSSVIASVFRGLLTRAPGRRMRCVGPLSPRHFVFFCRACSIEFGWGWTSSSVGRILVRVTAFRVVELVEHVRGPRKFCVFIVPRQKNMQCSVAIRCKAKCSSACCVVRLSQPMQHAAKSIQLFSETRSISPASAMAREAWSTLAECVWDFVRRQHCSSRAFRRGGDLCESVAKTLRPPAPLVSQRGQATPWPHSPPPGPHCLAILRLRATQAAAQILRV